MKTLQKFYNALNDQDKQNVNQPDQCKKIFLFSSFLISKVFLRACCSTNNIR